MRKMLLNLTVALTTFISTATAIAQESAAPAQGQPPGWANFVPFMVILVVFYFFIIRPQSKRQKEMRTFSDALKVGDQVITNSGILGRIAGINDAIVNLEIANNVQIKLLKSQIMSNQSALTKNN